MQKYFFSLFTTTSVWLAPTIARAQIYQPSNRIPVADNSQIGTQVSRLNDRFNITGGLQRGQNLFHSFTDFSVPTGGVANFINPTGNQSIITRVTGNLFSDINGLVNTHGANFLLINPNGVVFGSDVKLDVGKTFVISTATGVDFAVAGRNYNFGVNQAGDRALLKIAPNVAFNPARLVMGKNIPGSRGIENYGTLTTNNQGQYIGLIGGNISSQGGAIVAHGGRVDLGGLNTAGTIVIGKEGLVLKGHHSILGDVSLTDTLIDVSATGKLRGIRISLSPDCLSGSSINIKGKNVNLSTVALLAGLETNSGTQARSTGDINLSATGKLTLANAVLSNLIQAGAEGQIGKIDINARTIVGNYLRVYSGINEGGKGSGGNIAIETTGNLTLANSYINGSSYGQGDAGQITINANGKLFLDNSQIFNEVGVNGVGNSQGIKIDVGELELTNQSLISTSTVQSTLINATGNAGDIYIKAKENLTLTDSYIYSNSFGTGNGGQISLDTGGKLTINRSYIADSTFSRLVDKNGKVVANDNFDIITVLFPSQELFSIFLKATGDWQSVTSNTSIGNSQSIKIAARELELNNNSKILSGTGGKGNAGDIQIDITGDANISDSTITTNLTRYGEGNTGKIAIATGGKLTINNSEIQSIVAGGTGNSQGVTIQASELNLNNSSILTQTSGRGNAGDIHIFTTGDTILSNSIIYSSSNSLDVNSTPAPLSPFFPIPDLKGTKYSAGNIYLTSKGLILDNGNIISASDLGQGGNIKIMLSDKLLLRDYNGFSSTISTNSGVNYQLVVNGDNATISISMKNDSSFNSISVKGGGTTTIANTTSKSLGYLTETNQNQESFRGGGNGGNITISSPLVIALPGNNDISANAYQGNGGQVNIDSQGLFGIAYHPKGQESLFGNDIAASSTFGRSGVVNIITPGIDPGKESIELPKVVTDASTQISQVCSTANRQNKFTVTGRGGLPPTANDPLTADVIWQDARAVSSQPAISSKPPEPARFAPPAVGWVFGTDGKVTLIAATTAEGTTRMRVVCPKIK